MPAPVRPAPPYEFYEAACLTHLYSKNKIKQNKTKQNNPSYIGSGVRVEHSRLLRAAAIPTTATIADWGRGAAVPSYMLI